MTEIKKKMHFCSQMVSMKPRTVESPAISVTTAAPTTAVSSTSMKLRSTATTVASTTAAGTSAK